MDDVKIHQADDGSLSLAGPDGRTVEGTNPDTGRRSVAAGFETEKQARDFAKDHGLGNVTKAGSKGTR